MRYEDLFEEHSNDLFKHIENDGMNLVNTKMVLYRGSNQSKDNKTVVMKPRFDRKPTDTPLLIHDIMDVWFFEKFGIKARSQSVFSTPLLRFAMRYGNPTAILPKNEVTYIYSNEVKDMFHTLSHPLSDYIHDVSFDDINAAYELEFTPSMSMKTMYKMIQNTFSDDNIPSEVYNTVKNTIFKFMDTLDYEATGHLSPSDVGDVEVMIHCDEYYSVGRKSPESYKLEAKYGYLI